MPSSINSQSNKLGLGSLILSTIGYCLGGAIVSYLGFAIGLGGRSTVITVIICLLCGVFLALPFYLLSKLAIFKGSAYSVVVEGLGPKIGGVSQYLYLMDILSVATYALIISDYIASLLPDINKTALSIGIVVFSYIIFMFGIGVFAKLQSVFTIILIIALLLFSITGVYNLITNNINPFNFFDTNYFFNGIDGITSGIPILIFYTYLYCYIMFYGPIAQRPTKNIPKAMIIGGSFVIIIWFLVSIVATNVLPIEQVANQPLTLVANEIMPKPLALFFVIGGPIMAVITSMLAVVPMLSIGILQPAKEGWYPKVFTRTNKRGTPIVIYSFIMGIVLLLIVSGVPVEALINQIVLLAAIATAILYIAIYRFPVKHPELFDREEGKVSKSSFKVVSTIGVVLSGLVFYYSVQGITITQIVINVALLVIISIIANYLVNSGKVEIESNLELDLDSISSIKVDIEKGTSLQEH